MDFSKTLLFQKIQKSNTMVFADFDGTVFTPGASIATTPFYNLQTKKILNTNNIPLVFVTGRPGWSIKADIETTLFGLPKADAIIAGAGTIIYYRLPNAELEIDTQWEQLMQQSTITWKEGATEPWNREKIQNTIRRITDIPFTILPLTSDKHLIRLYVYSLPIDILQLLTTNITSLFSKGIKVFITEKLLQPNSLTIFSGNILIIPEKAGKDLAVRYILETFSKLNAKRLTLNAILFGDASVDVPMLTLKSTKVYTINTFGVNLTPLARKVLEEEQKENSQLNILDMDGPKAILEVLKKETPLSRTLLTNQHFTPAQNSFARRLIEPFEPVLDNILDKKLSPNDISLLGLDVVKKSIDILYGEKHITFSQKLTAIKQYFFGHFIDILDGTRYRQNKKVSTVFSSPIRRGPRSGGEVREPQDSPNTQDLPGQLVDVYCDRVKEFYQLYKRSQKRFTQSQEQGYQTLLSAISCILPSIARSQAELSGTIVKERDPNGGSMYTRTKKLFFSLLADTFGLRSQSINTDQKIYQSNMATFHNRLSHISSMTQQDQTKLSPLQHNAQERFLLLIQLIQEENEIIEQELKKYPEYLEKYKKEFKENIEEYLKLNVEKLRKEWNIQRIDLHITI